MARSDRSRYGHAFSQTKSAVAFRGKTANVLDARRIKEITDLVARGREQAGAPGVAISLVQGGKVVFEGGFGVRELGKPARVDADDASVSVRRAQDDTVGLVVQSDVIRIAALAAEECVLIAAVGPEALMPKGHCHFAV